MENSKNAKSDRLLIFMLIGIVLGVLCGWLFGPAMEHIRFLGDIFMNALKAVIVPLIMASIIMGIASLGDIRRLGSMGTFTILYYMVTTGIAVTIGLTVTNFIQPGLGVDLANITEVDLPEAQEFSLGSFILQMVPSNIFESMANTDVMPIIIASILMGIVLTMMGDEGKPLFNFFDSLNKAMIMIVHIIMYYAPIGIFALVAAIIGVKGIDELFKIWKFVATVLLGLGIHAFIVLPILLMILGKRSPIAYAKNMLAAFATAFSTDSSAATLPITLECVTEKNKVSNQTSSFVLPIGATMNMDGTALYEAAAAIFIAGAYGVQLDLASQLIIFLTATLASIGAAAIPHAGLVTMVIVLKAVNLPIEGIGLVFTVDWFLDRCRTTVNVWGDSVGSAFIDERVSPSKIANTQ